MSIIFSDDINDQRKDDLSKRVDTLYDYIAYMKEQLEFWARNRTKDIDAVNAKTVVNAENIAQNTEDIGQNTEDIGTLETAVTALQEIGTAVSASWTVASTSAAGTALTDGMILGKGTWILIIRYPVISNDLLVSQLASTTGTTDIDNDNSWIRAISEGRSTAVVKVSSDTATIRLESGSATANTFTYTNEGGITAIRIQ